MRLFLAINLPDDERAAIDAAAAPLREATSAVSWTKPALMHVTLKFLGEQDDAQAARIAERLGAVTAAHRPVPLEIDGFGAFPSWRAPKVVWVGIADEPKLELLHHDVESECAALGFELEGRPFRPHVTIGRVRKPIPSPEAKALAAAARAVAFRTEVIASSVDLMRSTLAPGGSRYDIVAALPLRGD